MTNRWRLFRYLTPLDHIARAGEQAGDRPMNAV
jgi:hypothetical protein